MTIPFGRTRALIHTYELLMRLQNPKETPRVPRWLRGHATALLGHYPMSLWWRRFSQGKHRAHELLLEGNEPAKGRGKHKGWTPKLPR